METIKIDRSFPSKAQFDLAAQYFTSTFTQNPQPVDTKEWSGIDLKPFDNSAITTLEEYIKRRWADISAETAGEQYTPDDVIGLNAEIIASKSEDSDRLLKIYDCTCGGGNLLFGVEDWINAKVKRLTQTFGQDYIQTVAIIFS